MAHLCRLEWASVPPEEFKRVVSSAYDLIPDEFRTRMGNIAVIVEPEPSADQLMRSRVPRGATLFGLYEGRPLTVRSVFDSFGMPDRITIFQGPHERAAHSPEHLAKLVEDTIWHEVAHYFGMNEAQVRSAERARGTL
jgi:predicted Zn-dependent protease with MMP-like domain